MKSIIACITVCIVLVGCNKPAKDESAKQSEVTADEIVKKLQQAAVSAPIDFMSVLDAAKKGDYQSQRNLAYGYAEHPYPGQEKNRVLGCAWYLVVLNSGHPQVDVGDETNAQTYCGQLDKDLLETSRARASQFLGEIKAVSINYGKS